MRLVVLAGVKRLAGEGVDLRSVENKSALFFHVLHQLVEDAFDAEDLFFADAKQVVVERAPFDDRSGGVVQAGGFIDDDRRIAGPGDDRPLLGGQGGPGHRGAAGHDQQRNAAMIENRLGGFERRRKHAGDQVIDAEFS